MLSGAAAAKRRNAQQTFEPESGLNKLFGLYDTGFIPNNSPTELSLDAWQVISPYRGGNAGTLRVNRYISDRYRTSERTLAKFSGGLKHSDKVIRLSNWYGWSRSAGRGELILSNGSVGVVCDHPGRRALYFPDASDTIWWSRLDDPEQLDLAYAITVHKSQGSEFDNVFAVFPDRQALLSRELVYTALTRSTGPLTLFIQKTERDGPLDVARTRSALLARNTSLFQDPRDWRRFLEPEPGVFVSSKIEYIIYRSLRSAQEAGHLTFGHEIPLDLKQNGTIVRIRPDFTIYVEGRTYYWEHLGMLDCRDYHDDWLRRRQLYRDNGLEDSLITTDDLNGVKQERIEQVIEEIAVGKIVDTAGSRFSLHHVVLGD